MALSVSVEREFVKTVQALQAVSQDKTLTGTIKTNNGTQYVVLDGGASDVLTPISSTTTGLVDGDRVLVQIKGHKSTVLGNMSNPSVTEKKLANTVETFNQLVGDKISVKQLEADIATIKALVADEATIEELRAGTITTDEVLAKAVEAGKISAETAEFVNMSATSANFTTLAADYLKIKDLEADSAKFNNVKTVFAKTNQLAAVNIDVDNLDAKVITTETLGVDSATVDELGVDKAVMNTLDARYIKADSIDAGVITTDNLDANVAKIVNADVENATIEALDTKYARMETVDANYANINLANITDAALDNLYAKTGIITDMTIEDGTVTGTLGAIEINADNITAGTMKADRLLIQGDDGLYYQLNTNGVDITGEQTNENSLDGKVILAKSIVADQISVSDLVAFGAKIAGMSLEEGRLYSMAKSEVGATTEGFYMDEEGQFAVGGGNDYIRYVKNNPTLVSDVAAIAIVPYDTPIATITVNDEGATATATVSVAESLITENDDAFSYCWQYAPQDSPDAWQTLDWDGWNAQSMTFDITDERASYVYTCLVALDVAAVTYPSTEAKINLKAEAAEDGSLCFIRQPQSVYAYSDDIVTFSVEAASDYGPYTYQWQRSADDATWTDIDSAIEATLEVKATDEAAGYKYRCVATDAGNDIYKLDINASSLNITVADGTNKSILQHTADGFVFDMSSITNLITANKIAGDKATEQLSGQVAALNSKTGWVRFGTTDLNDGQQGLILGSEDRDAGDITLQLVNNQLAFVQDGVPVAYITDNLFHIRQGVLTEELHLGEQTDTTSSWVWKKRASEHLGLRYQPKSA